MEIQFINITREEFLSKDRLYKFMPLENALRTLSSNELWFANPSTWKDPFEKRFLDAEYVDIDEEDKSIPYGERTYCMCVTQTPTSEAYWNTYSREQIGIKLLFFRNELLKQLEAYTDAYDIYIGKVEYMLTPDILKKKISEIPLSAPIPTSTKDLYVRLLLLKRIAYKYEDEIRIILIKKRAGTGDKPAGVGLKYNCESPSLISKIVLDPSIPQYTTELLKETFISKYGFTPIVNPMTGKTRIRVMKSTLYSSRNKETLIWDI